MADTDRLRHVRRGQRPSASQQNIIVDALKKSVRDNKQNKYQQFFDRVRITNGWTAYEVLQIDGIDSDKPRRLAYSTQTFSAPNSDDFEILICCGSKGWATFGYSPVMAAIDGTLSSIDIGEMVGPKHGEDALRSGYPGFRFLGESFVTGVGWVVRDRGIATGEGNIITSSGQTGVPSYFELDTVKFSSGFNGWDHSSDLSVNNKFGDTAEADLLVQFKWDVYSGEYVATDVECPA